MRQHEESMPQAPTCFSHRGDLPPAERVRHVVQQRWSHLRAWSPDDWALELVVFFEGQPVSIQEMRAEDFGIRREIVSGSWLGIDYQGQGIGTEMGVAWLHLAFTGLGAVSARPLSFADNQASMPVSRKLGYQPDGISRDVLGEQVVESRNFRFVAESWNRQENLPVAVSGLGGGSALFGIL
ncbi:GNAT family protein [Streptomyces sp. NPDC051453]|uniref:GNAT family N-acetyltransferase n=1 Tax=Streptomyces sp. NPDC051453 TaxID=3154941 RepID=UPI0034276344